MAQHSTVRTFSAREGIGRNQSRDHTHWTVIGQDQSPFSGSTAT